MGKNNQQRRAAKRKARAAAAPRPAPPHSAAPRPAPPRSDPVPGPTPSGGRTAAGSTAAGSTGGERYPLGDAAPPPSPTEQAVKLIRAAAVAVGNPDALDDAVRDLVVFAGTTGRTDPAVAERVATTMLLERLSWLYENGWQPADVVHVVRARLGNRFVPPTAGLIAAQARVQRAVDRAPQHWLDQLAALADLPLGRPAGENKWSVFDEWRRANAWDAWHDVLTLLGHVLDRHPMQRIAAPPSSWPTRRVPPAPRSAGGPAGHDPKKLATIRALLAKAEATTFAKEADAFTAKAQDLMTRYAIDEALLAGTDDGIEVRSRRVHVDNPYAEAKAQLLATVGRVNRVKAIWDAEHTIVTIVGLPVDLELAEMLFTSLLVQATRSMTEAGAVSSAGHRLDRSPSFRRAFLLAYAQRIGERLTDAGSRAQREESAQRGAELLPVLARQSAAVEAEFTRLFPDTQQGRAKQVDARGWSAGRAAADRAVLAKGQVGERSA